MLHSTMNSRLTGSPMKFRRLILFALFLLLVGGLYVWQEDKSNRGWIATYAKPTATQAYAWTVDNSRELVCNLRQTDRESSLRLDGRQNAKLVPGFRQTDRDWRCKEIKEIKAEGETVAAKRSTLLRRRSRKQPSRYSSPESVR